MRFMNIFALCHVQIYRLSPQAAGNLPKEIKISTSKFLIQYQLFSNFFGKSGTLLPKYPNFYFISLFSNYQRLVKGLQYLYYY